MNRRHSPTSCRYPHYYCSCLESTTDIMNMALSDARIGPDGVCIGEQLCAAVVSIPAPEGRQRIKNYFNKFAQRIEAYLLMYPTLPNVLRTACDEIGATSYVQTLPSAHSSARRPDSFAWIVRIIGSRKRPYFPRLTWSPEAKAVCTALIVAGVTISSRPTNTRTVLSGAGLTVSGSTRSMNPRGTM
jgi:hypothetical protein